MKQSFRPQAKECYGWESDTDADEDDEDPDQPENEGPEEYPDNPEEDKDTEDVDQPPDNGMPSVKAMNAFISQLEQFEKTFDEENAQQPSIKGVEVVRANAINDERPSIGWWSKSRRIS